MSAAPPPPPPAWQPSPVPPGPPAPTSSAAGSRPPGGGSPKRPIWKSPKAWAAGIVVVLALGAIGSMGRDRTPADEPAANATATPAGTATPAPSDSPTAAPLPTVATPATVPSPEAPTSEPSPTDAPTAPPPAAPLAITTPQDGEIVMIPTILVVGTGPADARIVRDVVFGFDDEVTSDADGSWVMEVALDPGPNTLTFRVGDDEATEVAVEVVLAPQVEPEPTEAPSGGGFATIDDGTWIVGEEVKPGTYRLREPADFCYWARLKGFGGGLNAIIANENVIGYGVVTIRASDRGFETSGCPTWTKDLSQVTTSKTRFGEGTFIVGTDLRPGTYRSTGGGELCYWARLRDFRGQLGSIIANDLSEGRGIVTIRSSDAGFTSSGCGDWVRR